MNPKSHRDKATVHPEVLPVMTCHFGILHAAHHLLKQLNRLASRCRG